MSVFADPREERRALLSLLADGEHPIELRYRTADGEWRKEWGDTPERVDEIAAWLTHRFDVFDGMLPRLGRAGDAQRRYASSRVLWADCDGERAVRKMSMFEPTPTAIVRSGGFDGVTPKRHAYWLLDVPLSSEDVRRHALRLAHHLEGDTRSCDKAHVLRVPGSRSHKTGRVARLESFTGEAYALDSLTGDLPDAPRSSMAGRGEYEPPSRRIVDGEGRHRYLEDFAARLVSGRILDRSDIAAILQFQFERHCEPLPPPRRDEFASLASWAVGTEIAERERAIEEFTRWVARLEITEERKRNDR